MLLYDVAHLEQRVTPAEPKRLGLGRQSHDVAIVRAQYADRLAAQARMEYLLNRAEKTVGIDQRNHNSLPPWLLF